jgi:hypothetical protein
MTRPTRVTAGLAAAVALMSLTLSAPVMAQTESPTAPGSGSAAPAAASAAPAVLALFPEAGFRVALPADWLAIELAPDPDAAEAAFAAAHPELADALATLRLSGPLDTFAVAPLVDGDPFPATFASFQGMNMGMSAQQMLTLGVSGLKQLGVDGDIEQDVMEISGVPAYHLGYAWDLPRPDGSTTPVHVDQFVLVTDSTVLVFSITDDVALPDHGAAIASSFELLP